MARISKEQQLHLDGMAFAYRIAKAGGVEALEKEIAYCGINNIPLNVSSQELTAVARVRASP